MLYKYWMSKNHPIKVVSLKIIKLNQHLFKSQRRLEQVKAYHRSPKKNNKPNITEKPIKS